MKKKTITALVERAKDGGYSVYYKELLPMCVHGEGDTAAEALEDFRSSWEAFAEELSPEQRAQIDRIEVRFAYDVASLLSYYARFVSLTAISELTGINRAQLSHYATGHRKPSETTAKKIEDAFHRLGAELGSIALT